MKHSVVIGLLILFAASASAHSGGTDGGDEGGGGPAAGPAIATVAVAHGIAYFVFKRIKKRRDTLRRVLADPVLSVYDDNRNGRISCREARSHGIAPVHDDHPAYPHMKDRNNDGVVCERRKQKTTR